MAQAAQTAKSPTKLLDSCAVGHFAPPMPTPREKRHAETRRRPHVRAESPFSAQQNHLAATTAATRSASSGASRSSRANTSWCRHQRATAIFL
eukprot:5797117-Pyramimonas_sp.AAC.1